MKLHSIGLKLLSWLKKLKGDAVALSQLNPIGGPTMLHEDWTNLLQTYASSSGQVNYSAFIQDQDLLDKYLADLSAHPPGSNWSKNEQLAYWINAYNAFTVKLIIDHYPLKSIKDIANGLPMINSPWDIKFFKIGNVEFDLNTIEHEILRKEFNEPRIHFAINCASFSCPNLRSEAYLPNKIEEQLDEQAFGFINNSDKNLINDKETRLSEIFNWFESDFTKESDLLDYIEKYNPSLKKANKVTYIEYDWSLNE
jgi:hypothetical protein